MTTTDGIPREVSSQIYKAAQTSELKWWRDNHIDVYKLWARYLLKFAPFIQVFDRVADVGCGPIPIFCSPFMKTGHNIAIDPNFQDYCNIDYYVKFWGDCEIEWFNDVESVSEPCNAVFCLNMLDHTRSPNDALAQMWRLIAPGGLFFMFVDLDRKPDPMHPHTITEDWLRGTTLVSSLTTKLWLTEKSWKFPNQVLYYVGERAK